LSNSVLKIFLFHNQFSTELAAMGLTIFYTFMIQ